MDLSNLNCVPCRGGEPALTGDEISELKLNVPDWEIIEISGIQRLQRVYRLKNFLTALDLTNKIGGIAEEEDHHPLVITEWGRVTVQWWTHVVKGLHKNDFIMAAKTDKLLE